MDATRLLPGESASTDPFLPGENPTAGDREDVEHWINVYSELLDFKRFMLDGASARVREMVTDTAKIEIETTDLTIVRAEAERLARRLAFWRSRLDALEGEGTQPPRIDPSR